MFPYLETVTLWVLKFNFIYKYHKKIPSTNIRIVYLKSSGPQLENWALISCLYFYMSNAGPYAVFAASGVTQSFSLYLAWELIVYSLWCGIFSLHQSKSNILPLFLFFCGFLKYVCSEQLICDFILPIKHFDSS